jgi:CRP-like cAMP-binding protein
LRGVGDHTLHAGDGTAFGTWALIDSAPSIVGARALERTRLLRITRSDFQELVGDHPELATGMLQALASRLRSLVA